MKKNITYKKITGWLLLCIAAAPIIFTVQFVLYQQYIHYKMDRLDNESHLISLTIPANDLHWVRADRELLINGKLFDVKSITIHNNTAFIKGYADEKEVILINTIKNGYQGKNSLVDFSTASFSFIFLPYFLLNREIAAEKNPLLAAEKIYFIKTDFFSSADVKIEIPPPKKSFINS